MTPSKIIFTERTPCLKVGLNHLNVQCNKSNCSMTSLGERTWHPHAEQDTVVDDGDEAQDTCGPLQLLRFPAAGCCGVGPVCHDLSPLPVGPEELTQSIKPQRHNNRWSGGRGGRGTRHPPLRHYRLVFSSFHPSSCFLQLSLLFVYPRF